MNPTSKKFISLFLVFSLVTINCATFGIGGGKRERRGAKLIIQRIGDQVKETGLEDTPWETSAMMGIRGELIAVKPNSLLLLDTEGKDVSIDIVNIKVIRVVKKSKVLFGAGLGAVICIGGWGLAGAILAGDEPPACDSALEFGLMMGACFSPIAALLGGIIGGVAGTDKTIHFEGMTDSEVREALEKLRKKARIRDYK